MPSPTEGPVSVTTDLFDAREGSRARARELSVGTVLLLSLAIYFALQVVTRVLLSSNLQLDEAEQFVLTQDWSWGYGSQGPLYNWLQKLFFELFGLNVLALSLLKNLALWSAYAFMFLAARDILKSARLAALATVSLLFFPQIAWESQRDQSHLVLATALAAATLFAFVRLLMQQRIRWYIAFGAAVALGFLTKYNYLLLVPALLFAASGISKFRPAILNRKILLAAGVFCALAAPHLIWMVQNQSAVTAQTYKLSANGAFASLPHLVGPLQLFQAVLAIVAAPIFIFSPLLWRAFKTRTPKIGGELIAMLVKAFVIGTSIALVGIVAFHVTYIRDRWLQPLFFALPIVLVAAIQPHLKPIHFRMLFRLGAAIALVVLVAINGTSLGANVLHRSHNLNIPYAALAAELRAAGFDHGTIVAKNLLLGGNLKNQFRESRVIVPEERTDEHPISGGKILIVWTARDRDVPEDFVRRAALLAHADEKAIAPRFIEVPSSNGPKKSERIGFVLTNHAQVDQRVSR
jgi:4-amino-4-deoxy-L-arabinose transferase-like glycosyltransferase